MEKQEFMLRDALNIVGVKKLAENISKNYTSFNKSGFVNDIQNEIDLLNFGDRAKLICKNLKKYLPYNYKESVKILIKSLNKELINNEMPLFEDFIIMPQCLFISTYGLSDEYFDISINALYEMTKRFTAEGDIRPFIIKYPENTHKILLEWSKDKNFHVRRLASEGSRPRLPLGIRLPIYQKNPKPVIQILNNLKEDNELYVRRSVANNLNDISKDNPQIVIDTLKSWNKIKTGEMNWLIKHSLRTLIKQGNKDALELLGYNCKNDISVKNLNLNKIEVEIGSELCFDFEIIANTKEENLMIDYIIHHMKANGKNKEKVFKLSKKVLSKGQKLKISKKHSFKPISTRKYYKGKHFLEIQINGQNYFMKEFYLI
ncbi:MAG: DNA alkylation repair protein [Candidatus Sericytochromatia bacterium]